MKQTILVHAYRIAISLAALPLAAWAATDLSNLPMSSASDLQVKPNILFVLDDSASMGWDYMPDLVGRPDSDGSKKKMVGYRNSKCNLVYYNPSTAYTIPKDSLGDSINPAIASTEWGNTPSTFGAALDDGFYFFNGGSLIQINLNSGFTAHQSDASQAAYYWDYQGGTTISPGHDHCKLQLSSADDTTTKEICTDGSLAPATCATLTPAKTALWKKVLVTDETAAKQLNFANWFSYYRTRLNMMKSASGRALVPLGASYRVGFITIEPGSPVQSAKFLRIDDFGATHKAAWFKKLYSQNVSDQTPLLRALSRAGRYYAGQTDGINDGMIGGSNPDPVQFSCQQNFTILTTDGYWNKEGGVVIGGSTLNTNQDGSLTELDAYNEAAKKFLVSPRPIYDGSVRYSYKTAINSYQDAACTYEQAQQRAIQHQTRSVQPQKLTIQLQKQTTQLQTATTQLQSRTIQNQQKTVQNQKKTIQNQTRTTQLQKKTTQLQSKTTQLQKRTIQNQKKTVQNQTRTTQLQRATTQLQQTATQLQKKTTQLQKRTIQNQKKTVQNQRRTTQLQKKTTQLQKKTTQLQKKTTQLQKKTVQNQKKTIQNQTRTTQLQRATTQLQQTTTQTQKKTTQLQRKTVQNQSKTTQIQKKILQLQQRTARFKKCSGASGTGSCVDVTFDCSSSTGDGSKPYCYITGDSGWVDKSTCSPSATETSTTVCRNNDLGWVNAGTCTAASINASGQTIQCQVFDPGWVNVGTCSAAALNASGQTVTCQVASDSGWLDAGTCSAANPSTGPTVTCQTNDPGWVNSSCTAAAINASGQTVTCQTSVATTSNAGTCTVAGVNAAGVTVTACPTTTPVWSNVGTCTSATINASGQTVLCNTTNPAWSNIGTCTPVAINASGQTVQCQEASNSGWVNSGTCSAANPAAGPTVTCQVASDSGWQNAGTCSAADPAAGPTITCNTVDPGWVSAGTCTAASINASGQTVTCNTVDPGWVNAGTCTAASINASGQTVTCQTTNPAWVNAGTCTAASINASGQTVTCQTTNPTWSNIGTCTPVAINASGQTVQCQEASNSGWVNSGTCSASNPTAGPTVTCQVASDTGWQNAGTCSASNPTSGPTITCNTVDPGWVNAGTCTAATINASGQTVTCQSPATTTNVGTCTVGSINAAGVTVTACTTTAPVWSNVGTCTPATINASGQTVLCQTTSPAWSNIGTCTPVAINASGQTVQCQEASNTGWVNSGTCSAANPAAGPTVTCQVASDSGWQNAGTCSAADPAAGPTITCNTVDPGWVNAGTCTAASINASGQTVTCNTFDPGWINSGTCTAATINASGQTITCQTTSPTWNNIGTCTPVGINASGQTVQCQEASNTGWVNVNTCNATNPASGPTVTCQESSNSGWVNVGSCAASNPASGPTVTCQSNDSGWVSAGSCIASNPANGPAITCQTTPATWSNAGTCSDTPLDSATGLDIGCQTVITSAWANVGACAAVPINASGVTTQCRETSNSGWINVGSCTASTPVAGPTVTCQNINDTGFVNSGTCTPSSPANGPNITCNTTSDTGWQDVASCTAAPSALPAITCQSVSRTGHQLQSRTTVNESIYRASGQVNKVEDKAPVISSWADSGVCSGVIPIVPPDETVTASGPPAPPSGCTAWPCEIESNNNGSSESLADVAQYYYKTDLRTASMGNCGTSPNVCANDVKTILNATNPEDDKATWQHMTTFTLGLGVSGSLQYNAGYKSSTTGDFAEIRAGTKDWPVPVRDGSAEGNLVEPAYAIDDLWHAAVNGRGEYFSATSPELVVSGLGTALSAINADFASGAGAAVTNKQLLASNNLAFVTTYLTKKWTGNVQALEVNGATGNIENVIWDAQAKLDQATKNACDNRSIKLFRQGATDNLVDFAWQTKACDASGLPTGAEIGALSATEKAYFDSGEVSAFGQYGSMSTSQRADAVGANLVNYLRGHRGNEGFVADTAGKLYRQRDHVLGDVVYAGPKYVAAPFAAYDDKGYAAFRTDQAARTPMVYVAANDGMLHAFYAGASSSDILGGKEAWAFIPSIVLPALHKLASTGYDNEHVFLVDGTPSIGDVCSSNCSVSNAVWNTILVGGLRAGGKGFYALDVTTPTAPKALWEFKTSSVCYDSSSMTDQFTDCHIGYSYGAPIITKLKDERWVVIVSSGYNNVNVPPISGDGQGYLYVLEAMTGKILYKVATGVGSASEPSGMANISARATETLRNNTAEYVYGTDLLGNIWRFDINNLLAPSGIESSLVAQVVDSGGVPQPITTTPILGVVDDDPFVYVGTGRYLGSSDLLSPVKDQTQTIWAIKDPLSATPVINLRSTFKKITTTTVGSGASAYRTNSCADASTDNCNVTFGWFNDLPEAGERVSVDMQLELGSLLTLSTVPPASACEIGGSSWINFVDAATGLKVNGAINSSTASRILDANGNPTQGVGISIIRTTGGQVKPLVTTRQGGVYQPYSAFSTSSPTGKRVSWREITQ